ncbi:MAG: hypothetical protein LCH79_11455 [Proteobacteria bacterium]|nr:hypothetical protein [Pseudomonadota bacterium]
MRLSAALDSFGATVHQLPGIATLQRRNCLLEQLVESERRIRYYRVIQNRPISPERSAPSSLFFDPVKAALLYRDQGQLDEACWMAFYAVHFGKNAKGGWRYAKEIYGAFGDQPYWTWNRVAQQPRQFREWLDQNIDRLRRPGVAGGFSNHRKYQSLDAYSEAGTGSAFETYVKWVDPTRGHAGLISDSLQRAEGSPRRAFDLLYREMTVASFGRLARFDYLTILGKLGLAQIEPGSTYMQGATGPKAGGTLLLGQEYATTTLDNLLIELDQFLGIGMQAIEDALCNWQKSPDSYVAFRG